MTIDDAGAPKSGPAPCVYLDYNAGAPVRPQARDAVCAVMERVGNPSSVHGPGRAARAALERARERLGRVVNADPAGIVFTSGGTEAMALALGGAAAGPRLIAAIEHACARAAAPGGEIIPATAAGVVDLAWLERRLAADPKPAVVAVMFASNETGVRQPLAEVSALCRARGVAVVCDAVQGLGKAHVDFQALDVDAMAVSAHKIGGLPGCGALIAKRPERLSPLIAGGGQERGKRGGTHNLHGAVSFGAAALAGAERLDDDLARYRRLGARLEAAMRTLAPAMTVWGEGAPRIANTLCVRLPGVHQQRQLMALDLAGVAVSAGSACSSGKIEPSHVLLAMGASPEEARESIRLSWGWATEEADIDAFLAAWAPLARAAGARPAA